MLELRCFDLRLQLRLSTQWGRVCAIRPMSSTSLNHAHRCHFLSQVWSVWLPRLKCIKCTKMQFSISTMSWASLVAQETRVWSLSEEDPLQKEMAAHSSVVACEIPWAEESGRLVHGVARVKHDLANKLQQQSQRGWPWVGEAMSQGSGTLHECPLRTVVCLSLRQSRMKGAHGKDDGGHSEQAW